jgi:hypothetical protein
MTGGVSMDGHGARPVYSSFCRNHTSASGGVLVEYAILLHTSEKVLGRNAEGSSGPQEQDAADEVRDGKTARPRG